MASSAFYQAFVEIVPESKNLRRTLSKEFDVAGVDAGNRAGKGINTGILGSIGRLAAPLAIAFAGLGIGKLFSDSITAASDLNEAGTAVEEIFGPAYGTIAEFAKGANKNLGQSNLEALNAAKSFGIFGQAAGLSGADNADFSMGLTGLATDLASFNNTSPEQAIDAIGAALRGESEPLRQYGVLLDDATLRAKALEMGIYDGQGALTQQQRILAAEAAIYDQTSVAQGDFADTSDGLANQQRILSASFENSSARLGESLLPAMTFLADFANDTLVPILDGLIDTVGPVLADALIQAAPAFTQLVEAIVPLIPNLVQLGVEVLPPLVDLLIAVSPAVVAIVDSLTDFFEIVGTVSDFLQGDISFTTLYDNVNKVGGPIGDVYEGIMIFGFMVGRVAGQVVLGAQRIWAGIQTNIGNAVTLVQGMPGRILAAVVGFGTLLFSSGKSLLQGFIDGINAMIKPVKDVVGGVMELVAGFFPNSPAKHGPLSGAGWRAIGSAGAAIGAEFGAGLVGSSGVVASSMGAFMSNVDIPNVAARIDASVSGSGSAGAAGRPILMDGALIGWMRDVANGEARIVLNTSNNSRELNMLRGRQA